MSSDKKTEPAKKAGPAESQKESESPLQINADTELIEVSEKKFKFINCKFTKPKQKMYDSDFDVKLRVGSQVYQAHREVLKEASSYFAAMFSSNFREKKQNEIELKDVPPSGFDAMLEYFYRGHITISDENVGEVVEAARFFQSDWLVSACRVFLVQQFVFVNCDEALAISDKYQLGNMWDNAFQFLGANFAAFIQREMMARVNFKVLLAFLKSDKFISVSESDVLTTIVTHWGDHVGLRPLLAALRLPLLAKEDLNVLRGAAGLDPKKKKKEKQMNKDEKRLDDAALRQLTDGLKAMEKADMDSMFSAKARGARPVLLVISSMEHNVILQFVSLTANLEPVCLAMDTYGRAPVALEASVLVPKGQRLLCLGGYDAKFCSSTSASAFNPSSLTWDALEPMKQGRVSHAAVMTPHGVAAVGGVKRYVDKDNADAEAFLPDVELLYKGSWRALPALPKGLFDHAAAFVNNAIFVSGGISDDPSDPIPSGALYRLPLKADGTAGAESWEVMPEMKTRRQRHFMIAFGGQLLVFGGTTMSERNPEAEEFGHPEPCLKNEVFDPRSGKWNDLPDTPADYKRVYSPHVVIGDVLYLCTGDGEAKFLRLFNLSSKKWIKVAGEDCLGEICTHLAYLEVGLPV